MHHKSHDRGTDQDESTAGARKRRRNGNREVDITPYTKDRLQQKLTNGGLVSSEGFTHRTMLLFFFCEQTEGETGEVHLQMNMYELKHKQFS